MLHAKPDIYSINSNTLNSNPQKKKPHSGFKTALPIRNTQRDSHLQCSACIMDLQAAANKAISDSKWVKKTQASHALYKRTQGLGEIIGLLNIGNV